MACEPEPEEGDDPEPERPEEKSCARATPEKRGAAVNAARARMAIGKRRSEGMGRFVREDKKAADNRGLNLFRQENHARVPYASPGRREQ